MNIELLTYLRSKAAWIFIFAVIVSGLFVIEKNYVTEFRIQHGTYAAEIVVKVDMPNTGYYDRFLNYELLLTSSTMTDHFFSLAEQNNLKLDRFNSNFNHYSQRERIQWFQHNLRIRNLGDNTIQMALEIPPGIPGDEAYIQDSFKAYYTLYITAITQEIQKIEPNAAVRIISVLEEQPEVHVISKTSILIKYAIIGFVLGGILGCVILGAYHIRRKNG